MPNSQGPPPNPAPRSAADLSPDPPDTPKQTPLGDYLRQQAARQRDYAAAKQQDPRHLRSAQSLDDLAQTADREIQANGFYACNLLRHFDGDGFAWPDGRAARAIADYGYLQPPDDHDEFIAELSGLVTLDVCSHISQHETEVDRRDAPAMASRYGVGLDRIHNALDRMRYPRLYQVGIPHWHELSPATRDELEQLDGVWVESASAVHKRRQAEPERPTHVNNVGAKTEDEARGIVAAIATIDPDALGLRVHPRIFPPAS
jgi:GrpB-like predicted nucleotidyltransferase (UPF0157 family)